MLISILKTINTYTQAAQKIFTVINCVLLSLLIGNTAFANEKLPQASLAIIIDDIGNNFHLGKRAIELPGELTFAVLPDTPQGTRLANYAEQNAPEKEIILHMPMEAKSEQQLGQLGLYDSLKHTEFSHRLERALAEIPQARGVSNHMGSHLTRQHEKMKWLMAELQPRNLFFVDSRTTKTNAASQAAQQYQVPYIARDVFLDHNKDAAALKHYFEKAIRYAQQDGLAVLIGHPYRSTLSFLEQELPKLEARGIKLIKVSAALAQTPQNQQVALNIPTPNSNIIQ